jgi:hypothetical protein
MIIHGWASKREDLRGWHLVRGRLEVGRCRIANPQFRKVYFSVVSRQLHPEFSATVRDDPPQSYVCNSHHFAHYLGIKRGYGYD